MKRLLWLLTWIGTVIWFIPGNVGVALFAVSCWLEAWREDIEWEIDFKKKHK